MTTTLGPASAYLTALESVVSRLETLERQLRTIEAQRVQLLAEAFDIAAAESENPASSTPHGRPAELAHRAVRAEIATALRVSEHTIDRRLSHARTLTVDYPRVFTAYQAGALSERHTTVILDAGTVIGAGDDPALVMRRARYETAVLGHALEQTPARLRPIARRLAEQEARTTIDERHTEARTRRRVWVVDCEDGMADLVAHLPAAEAHAIHRRLTSMSRALERRNPAASALSVPDTPTEHTASREAAVPASTAAGSPSAAAGSTGTAAGSTGTAAGSTGTAAASGAAASSRRGRDETRADLLTDILLGFDPTGTDFTAARGIIADVQVIIPAAQLPLTDASAHPTPDSGADSGSGSGSGSDNSTNRTDRINDDRFDDDRIDDDRDFLAPPAPPPAMLSGYGPIDPTTAGELAGAATHWERVHTTPDGTVLSVDRYRPSEEMRRFLRARDQHCRFPGCRIPLARCDIDHTIDAQHGGKTTTTNLAHLCRGHHTLKHHTGWRVQQDPTATLTWTSPTGRTHTERPPSRVTFAPHPHNQHQAGNPLPF